jgi:hypothetical protein
MVGGMFGGEMLNSDSLVSGFIEWGLTLFKDSFPMRSELLPPAMQKVPALEADTHIKQHKAQGSDRELLHKGRTPGHPIRRHTTIKI